MMTTHTLAVDPRDAILFSAFPLVPAPRFGNLTEIEVGSKRLVLGGDGLYLEVRSAAMHARLRLSAVRTPYGDVSEFIRPTGGPLPTRWIGELAALAIEGGTLEVAAGIVLDGDEWAIQIPPMESSSESHITYHDVFDDDRLLIDMHSHGALPEFFSSTDDASDLGRKGPYIAVVLGRCDSRETLKLAMRFVCAPYLIPLDAAAMTRLGVF
jgi:PRTRC genetic system protein A